MREPGEQLRRVGVEVDVLGPAEHGGRLDRAVPGGGDAGQASSAL